MRIPLTSLMEDTIIYSDHAPHLYRVVTSKTTGYDRGIVEVINRRNGGTYANIKLISVLPVEYPAAYAGVDKIGDVFHLMKHWKIATDHHVQSIRDECQSELEELRKRQERLEYSISILDNIKCNKN